MHKHRNLFTDAEWNWFLELGASKHDPEEKKTFYEGVIEQKLLNKEWDFLKAFPKEDLPTRVCSFVRSLKKEETTMMEAPQRKELKELGELFSRLISEGKHLSDKEAS